VALCVVRSHANRSTFTRAGHPLQAGKIEIEIKLAGAPARRVWRVRLQRDRQCMSARSDEAAITVRGGCARDLRASTMALTERDLRAPLGTMPPATSRRSASAATAAQTTSGSFSKALVLNRLRPDDS
jgi:hypothetical protein